MRLRVDWSPQAGATLLRIHYLVASDVGAAVHRFAATGEGNLYSYDEDAGIKIRLATETYHAVMTVNREEGVVRVWHLYRP
ncbi:hypothetical protein [Sorangium sp. So ce204]|uniref:hypothetical protein n=1 Tax=Sorangium sp. So ce204 TaxID=3133288 RepID=UPI003F5F8216